MYGIARCTYDDIVRPIANIFLVSKRRRRELSHPILHGRKDQALILRFIESSRSYSGNADILLQKFFVFAIFGTYTRFYIKNQYPIK